MNISDDILKEMAKDIKVILHDTFNGEYKFDPVELEHILNHDGADNLKLTAVYHGDYDGPHPYKINLVSGELISMMTERLGIQNVPLTSYIHESEYDEWLELGALPLWELAKR